MDSMDSMDHLHLPCEAAVVSLILALQTLRVKVQEVPHGTKVALFRGLVNVGTSARQLDVCSEEVALHEIYIQV